MRWFVLQEEEHFLHHNWVGEKDIGTGGGRLLKLVVTSCRIRSDSIFFQISMKNDAKSSDEGEDVVAWVQEEGVKGQPQQMDNSY